MFTKEHISTYPTIGQVAYKRNHRARRLTIRIKRTGEVKITIPGSLPFKAAEDFVLSKTHWIAEKIQDVESRKQVIITEDFKTRFHLVKLSATSNASIQIKYGERITEVQYPSELGISSKAVQNAIKKATEFTYRAEALEYLPKRLELMANTYGFKYGKLTIRNTITRWGSCTAQNNINLSLHLMKLPDKLIDYILLHELCHTVQKNHGPKFWELLNLKTGGNAKYLAKEVKNYSTMA